MKLLLPLTFGLAVAIAPIQTTFAEDCDSKKPKAEASEKKDCGSCDKGDKDDSE